MPINSLIVSSGQNNPGPFAGMMQGREARQNHLLRAREMSMQEARQPLLNHLLGQQVQQGEREASAYDAKVAAQNLHPYLAQAAKIASPASSRQFLAEAIGSGRIPQDDAADIQAMFAATDDVYPQIIAAARDKAASVSGIAGTGNMVQSSQILDNGNLALVLRNGQIVDTGQKAATSYTVTDVAGGRAAVDRRTGQAGPFLSTPAQEIQSAADKQSATTIATEQAKVDVESRASAPGDLADIEAMERSVLGLLADPALNSIYGAQGWVPDSLIPSAGQSALSKLKQLNAQAFSVAIQKMRGMGALSNVEGVRMYETINRAQNRKLSNEEARVALNEVLDYLALARARIQRRVGAAAEPAPAPQAVAPAAPAGWSIQRVK